MDINVDKFQRDYNRMCDMYISRACHGCPVGADNVTGNDCDNIKKLEFIAPIVQKWTEEHPAKTYLMDMKEKFPKLVSDDSFYNNNCVGTFYGRDFNCMKDCRDCWNREME